MSLNPLDDLSDNDLWNLNLMLALACGKAKVTLHSQQKKHFCNLFQISAPYTTSRGVALCVAPYSASQAKPSNIA